MDSSKEDELSKLRRTIENQRLKAELGKEQQFGNTTFHIPDAIASPKVDNVYPVFVPPEQGHWSSAGTISAGSTLTRSNAASMSPDSTINKRISSGSLSSVSSHVSGSSSSASSAASSAGSGPEVEAALKQSRKKRWLPMKSAKSKTTKSQSSSHPDLADSEDSGCPISPMSSTRNLNATGSVGSTAESEAIQELLRVARDKEKKLTDIRLEALASQHQIHQLREQITQMQNEMQLLRLENERLQEEVEASNQRFSGSADERSRTPRHAKSKSFSHTSSSKLTPIASREQNVRGHSKSPSCHRSTAASPLHRQNYQQEQTNALQTGFAAIDCRNLQSTLSPDSESEGCQVRFVVTSSSTMLLGKRSVVIGSLPVPRRASWSELDRTAETVLSEYCRVIDGDSRLGLSATSIESYRVGDFRREIGGKTPVLLPCAYIVGDVDTVELNLREPSKGCTDQMAFDMLISRETLDCYISQLLQYGRVVLEGPPGAGKSSFAMSLSEYLVARLRTEGGNTMVSVLDAEDGEEKLRSNIAELASRSQRMESPSVPAVLVVENLHHLSSWHSALDQLLTICGNGGRRPYIIATTHPVVRDTVELHYGFKVISCACDSPHIQRYITRALRRSLVEHILTSQHTNARENDKLSNIILWISLCWQHVNRFLESQSLRNAFLGPKVFLKIPISATASCNWFVNFWNRTIIPHLGSAVMAKRASDTTWEDPTKWIIKSFPWDSCETGVNPMKQLHKLENSNHKKLPSCPQASDVESRLRPPPVPVRSPTGPTYQKHPAINGHREPRSLCTNGNGPHAPPCDVWRRPVGPPTLQRQSARPHAPAELDNAVDAKSEKYLRSDGEEDTLKSMLAQLKQAAMSTDFNSRNHV